MTQAVVKGQSEQAGPHHPHGFRRKMTGRVISNKMKKTVVVECVSHRRDRRIEV